MVKKNTKDDFDITSLVKEKEHKVDIESLSKRIDRLEDRFGNNEKIAKTLCDTAENATKMTDMLSERFVHMLENNLLVKNKVKELVNNEDRNYVLSTIKKIGWLFAWLVSVAISAFVGAGITSFFK